jgi:hypothetical protein
MKQGFIRRRTALELISSRIALELEFELVAAHLPHAFCEVDRSSLDQVFSLP